MKVTGNSDPFDTSDDITLRFDANEDMTNFSQKLDKQRQQQIVYNHDRVALQISPSHKKSVGTADFGGVLRFNNSSSSQITSMHKVSNSNFVTQSPQNKLKGIENDFYTIDRPSSYRRDNFLQEQQ